VKARENAIFLHNICDAYGVLPSDYLQVDTPWARWQVDVTVLLIGRQAEAEAIENKQGRQGYSAVGRGQTSGYRSAAPMRGLRKVKIRENGTW
jgi:hypothetical protein